MIKIYWKIKWIFWEIPRNFVVHPIKRFIRYGTFNRRKVSTKSHNRRRKVARIRFIQNHPICAHCGSREDLTIDHIIPRSRGGTNIQSNWQILCSKCNFRKGDKIYIRA